MELPEANPRDAIDLCSRSQKEEVAALMAAVLDGRVFRYLRYVPTLCHGVHSQLQMLEEVAAEEHSVIGAEDFKEDLREHRVLAPGAVEDGLDPTRGQDHPSTLTREALHGARELFLGHRRLEPAGRGTGQRRCVARVGHNQEMLDRH